MANQLKVLYIDDEPEITEIVQAYFTSAGHHCVIENSAKEAINKAKSTSPDIILLDIKMPEISGLEICSMLKKDSDTADIPVILLSGKAGDYSVDEIYQCGCELLVKKPFSCERLMELVKPFTTGPQ